MQKKHMLILGLGMVLSPLLLIGFLMLLAYQLSSDLFLQILLRIIGPIAFFVLLVGGALLLGGFFRKQS